MPVESKNMHPVSMLGRTVSALVPLGLSQQLLPSRHFFAQRRNHPTKDFSWNVNVSLGSHFWGFVGDCGAGGAKAARRAYRGEKLELTRGRRRLSGWRAVLSDKRLAAAMK